MTGEFGLCITQLPFWSKRNHVFVNVVPRMQTGLIAEWILGTSLDMITLGTFGPHMFCANTYLLSGCTVSLIYFTNVPQSCIIEEEENEIKSIV